MRFLTIFLTLFAFLSTAQAQMKIQPGDNASNAGYCTAVYLSMAMLMLSASKKASGADKNKLEATGEELRYRAIGMRQLFETVILPEETKTIGTAQAETLYQVAYVLTMEWMRERMFTEDASTVVASADECDQFAAGFVGGTPDKREQPVVPGNPNKGPA